MSLVNRPLEVLEIVQPICSRTFGVSPCNATGTPCWGTDETCKFRAALDMTDSISIHFVKDQAWEWLPGATAFQPALAIPSLKSVDTAPTVLNVAGGSEDYSPMGLRAVLTAQIADIAHNDYGLDPYLADRAYDTTARGTYWGKWLAAGFR